MQSNHSQPNVATFSRLTEKLRVYLSDSDIARIREAFRFADEMHLGQMRISGEPYISHPLAVAEICAEWKLDDEAIMAALLHDVMEDKGIKKEELIEHFSAPVAEMVDGLSKLEKMEFQNYMEAQGANFRKMLLAMASDVRIILIKLADRLHNMRTLDSMRLDKRKRISHETMEVYVPIAHRLGINNLYRELQELSFSNIYPLRYKTLEKAIMASRDGRAGLMDTMQETALKALNDAGIEAEIYGREKTLFGIYRKMRVKQQSFSQILDINGFRVVVNSLPECYMALGVLHSLYKPMPGKVQDHIAIPKVNKYQSLHTTVIGLQGTPVEFLIRTHEMHHVAEVGVASHWLFKEDYSENMTEIQENSIARLQSLLDIQKQTGNSVEFLEHVKFDLFPDSVYVFTPRSKIISLPRSATALDFAYEIHTDVGNQATGAMINNEPAPLHRELQNGDIVEITTFASSHPSPSWLNFVRTGKARSSIRNYLRSASTADAIMLGKRLLAQALSNLHLEEALSESVEARLLHESGAKSMDEFYTDIGTGKRLAKLVAHRVLGLANHIDGKEVTEGEADKKEDKVLIFGSEGVSVQFSDCCYPIPGDDVVGNLNIDSGLTVHAANCDRARRLMIKEAQKWITLAWGDDISRRFDCHLSVEAEESRGLLARLIAEMSASDVDITHVDMLGDKNDQIKRFNFTVQIRGRDHLARVMRRIRHLNGVERITRE